mgnify:CR=1 FL=1
MKKQRKPRGIKKNGHKSYDLCPGCFSYNCDPMSMSFAFQSKIDKRRKQGLCPACGNKPCSCKSSLISKN